MHQLQPKIFPKVYSCTDTVNVTSQSKTEERIRIYRPRLKRLLCNQILCWKTQRVLQTYKKTKNSRCRGKYCQHEATLSTCGTEIGENHAV